MATKGVLTTQTCRNEKVKLNTYHNPYLPIQGWGGRGWGWGVGADTGRYLKSWIRNDPQRSAKQNGQGLVLKSHVSPAATPQKPAGMGRNRWPSSVVSTLTFTLPKLQFSHVKCISWCRDIILAGNFSPRQREAFDQELGWPFAVAVWAVFAGLSVAPRNTDIWRMATSATGQVSHTEYTACKLKKLLACPGD